MYRKPLQCLSLDRCVVWKTGGVQEGLKKNRSGCVTSQRGEGLSEAPAHPNIKLTSPSVPCCKLHQVHLRFWIYGPRGKSDYLLELVGVQNTNNKRLQLPLKVKHHAALTHRTHGLCGLSVCVYVCVMCTVGLWSWSDTRAIFDNDNRLAWLLPDQIPKGSAPLLFIHRSGFQQTHFDTGRMGTDRWMYGCCLGLSMYAGGW